MFTFTLPLFFIFLILSTTTTTTSSQPYKATENFLLNCGSPTPITDDGRAWDSDENSQFIRSNILTTSFSSQPSSPDRSNNHKVYTSARIFNTSAFTYKFPVSQGPKFLRLYFYATTYSNLNSDQSFFSATSNGFSLLTNFNPSLTASFLSTPSVKVSSFVKEFIIYIVKDTQILNLTFTPSPNSFAFINGIEVVSMPENLYFKPNNFKPVGTYSAPGIDDHTALENMYRLNVGGGYISGENDTGMYRSWDADNNYVFSPTATGLTPVIQTPITYSADTPNYTAPELVYQTQRSMGNLSMSYNLTWTLPVDSGFWYMVRLHFCNIITVYTHRADMVFQIFIQNQTAEEQADLFVWTPGSHYAVFKDYLVFVGSDSNGEQPLKPDLWVALHPNDAESGLYRDGFLNGLEVFKLSIAGNLSSPNPEASSTTLPPPQVSTLAGKRKNNKTPVIVGAVVGVVIALLLIFVLIVFMQRRRVKQYETPDDDRSSWTRAYSESKSTKSVQSTLPSDRCRRFPLTEILVATNDFNDDCVIGMGGFGKVYKGDMENLPKPVAIKRLNSASSQGSNEFTTEIRMLSKLRHVNLVPLLGYCDDEGEMILVYEYMAHGTLREHLYKTNDPLPWEKRLNICINAARGLHYLHTGADCAIIHRDVKSTNILLDENFVGKVSDFGLSKDRDSNRAHVTTAVKGSLGYVDPEYYRTGQLTDKSDVYSFGVLLLEVLCARPVLIPSLPKDQRMLVEWGKLCYRKKGTLEQIVDVKVKGEISPECLKNFGEVAIECLKEQKSGRPTMEEVVWKLEFALKLQESGEKRVGEVGSDNQEFPFLMQGGNTTTDDEAFTGSSAMRNGMSPISSSFEGYKSETVFSEMQKSTGR